MEKTLKHTVTINETKGIFADVKIRFVDWTTGEGDMYKATETHNIEDVKIDLFIAGNIANSNAGLVKTGDREFTQKGIRGYLESAKTTNLSADSYNKIIDGIEIAKSMLANDCPEYVAYLAKKAKKEAFVFNVNPDLCPKCGNYKQDCECN